MITVVGGTGRLGRLVIARLVAQGLPVRAAGRSAPVTPVPGAEFVAADVRDPASLPPALAGSRVVVSAVHGMDPAAGESPATVDRNGNRNLVRAARETGADIVLVSIVGARDDHPIELFRMKAAAEAALVEEAAAYGLGWTIVRATAFADMWLDLFRSTAGRSGVPKVLGRGRNPVNFVAVDDVAVAVARACTDPSLHGQVVEVAGEDLTETALAGLVTRPGRRPAHIPTPVVWAVGNVLRPVRPGLARVARQALLMERVPMRADPVPGHQQHPWLPLTPVSTLVAP
ncbi:nucleotide-diphosphate-sugar epimerase [Terrabacter tumescens]|uniref:Nucleotide-diphosphate-sugar epimerase n=1 Tax=Terrabacter tumescens TaxID=60443 RepID=A0ABQ2HL02_9MICO|nr:NAD(P)H-binding protein [Terrabacter tumescens]GGM83563.1 nucleotide-diphosphate-sugar epimerase [Terrabacter tumescens]